MPQVVVLTTTETSNGRQASQRYLGPTVPAPPHIAYNPDDGWVSYFNDYDEPVDRVVPGQNELRPGGVFWMDVVGYADRLPDDESWWDALAEQVAEVCRETETPFEFPYAFLPFREAGGPNQNRMDPWQWEQVSGVVGLQHVPGLQGGEPGDLTRLVERAGTGSGESQPIKDMQNLLARSSMYSGPVNGIANRELADSVSALADSFTSAQSVSEAQARQIQELAQSVDARHVEDQRFAGASSPIVALVDVLYGEDAAVQVQRVLSSYYQ